MSLSCACSSWFDSRSRSRGDFYFNRGRVELMDVERDTVIARVQGTLPEPYEVQIDFDHIAEGAVVAECTCPRYDGGELCKHVWATLRAIERQGMLQAGAVGQELVVMSRWELDDWKLDSRDAGTSIIRAFRGVISRPNGSRQALSNWQSQLQPLLTAPSSNRDAGGLPDWREVQGRNEVWYVLNVATSMQTAGLVVDLFQRTLRKDGSRSKIKRWGVRRNEVNALGEPEDRQLLQLLLGNDLQQENGYNSHYSSSYTSFATISRVVVTPPMFDLLLPRLCASGRFVWLLDTAVPVEEAAPVVWDGGEPWRVRLQVQSQPAEQQWQLSGELFREGQVRSLDEPVLLLARGLVLFPECLARLDAAEHFAWIAALRKQPVIEIPHRDRQAFQHSLWTAANVPPIELPAELQLEQVQGVPQGKLSIHAPDRAGSPSELLAEVRFLYGEHAVPLADRRAALLDADQGRAILRDSVAERALLAQLADLGMYPPPRYLPGQADVHFPLRSLAQVVEQLTAQGWLVESEGRLIRRAGAIHLSVSTAVDWFELGGGVDFDGVEVPLPRLLAALRNKHKYVRLDDGTHGLLPDEWLQQFSGLIDLSDADADVLRFSPSQALLLDSLLAAQEDVQVDDPFDQLRQRLRTFEGVEPCGEPRGFRGELRNYQKDGLGWLHFLREFRFGGCLADDMGLGKTVQVLALLQSRRTRRLKQGQQRRPSLVVVPKSLVFNWIDEATRFAPRLRVLDYTGLGRHALLQQLDQCDLLVTTYGTLRRDVLPLKEIRFDYVILDESQAIKNANSQAAKACRLLQADHRLAMTGTPVENHLGELWSLFEFLNPGMLGRSRAFHDFVKQGQESGESARLLSRALRPFLLRRTKEQVLSELPDKTEQTLHCEMAPKQRKLYEELREYYRRSLAQRVEQVGIEQAKIHVLEALLRLRQAACHPGLLDATRIGESSAKLDLLLAQIREIVAEGHKALVFSQFTSLLAIVRTHLDKLDIPYEYLDGRTRDRKERVQRFQEDAGCPLFLISLKAGGHGLNLTAADYVFILDPWWNPAVESQAIDRAHRLGQTRNVFAYRLICRDTVEDKIVELQRSKRELADAIISADNSLIRQLSVEDLQLLLS